MKMRALLYTVVVVLAAAVVVTWKASSASRTWYTDADTIRVPSSVAPIRSVLWQPAELVPDAGDAGADQYEPRVSADGSILIFVRGRAGKNADLFQSRRTVDGWTQPEPIAAINTTSDELGPSLSRDGKALYFYSDRVGGRGGFDIWVSRANDKDWGEPVNLGPSVNTEFNEYGPALTPDGRTLYFSSNRPRPGEVRSQRDPWPATIREERSRHDYDLFRSELSESGPSEAAPVLELNTAADEGAPAISPVGDFLYFASDRSGGRGGFDVYRSRLLKGVVQAPENLGGAINTDSNDLDPALSTDGFRLYFSSDRTISAAASPAAGSGGPAGATSLESRPARYALWSSGSREVFTEVEPLKAGELLGRIWSAAWPWLLLLVMVLLLALLSYFTMRDATLRRRLAQLSLMAKCILISLLIHAAILSMLAVWRVGNAIGSALHSSGGGGRVTIGSSGSGGLASQVRGSFTTASIEAPSIPLPRALLAMPEAPIPAVLMSSAPAALTVIPTSTPAPTEDASPAASPVPVTRAPDQNTRTSEARAPRMLQPLASQSEKRAALSDAAPVPTARPTLEASPMRTESARVAPAPSGVPDIGRASAVPFVEAAVGSGPTQPTSSVMSRAPAVQSRIPSAGMASAPSESLADAATDFRSARAAAPIGTPISTLAPTNLAPAPSSVAVAPAAMGSPATEASASESRPPASQAIVKTPAAAITSRVPTSEAPGSATPNHPGRESAPDIGALAFSAARGPKDSRPGLSITPEKEGLVAHVDPGTSAGSSAPGSLTAGVLIPGDSTVATSPDAHRSASGVPPSVGAITARLPDDWAAASGEPSKDGNADAGPFAPLKVAMPGPRPGVAGPPSGAAPVAHVDPGASESNGQEPALRGQPASMTEASTSAGSTSPLRGAPGVDLPSNTGLASRLPAIEPEPAAPKPTENFAQRAPEKRAEILNQMGGTKDTERAVTLALEWFKSHQDPAGYWSGRHFDDRCRECSGEAEIDSDAAMTGMTLLCFLGAGHTHTADGPYRDLVKQGLAWLVNREDDSGDLRRGETMYSQTIAAVALCEAYAMTRDRWLEGPARRAVMFVARGPGRQGNRSASDTSVLGWQIMGIKSAERAGFNVPTTAYDAAKRWLDQTASRGTGRYGYRPGESPSAAATAEAMFVQQLLGHTRDEPRMRDSAQFILATPPAWRQGAPTHYWYYATLALFQQQGESWQQWNSAIARELLANQHRDGASKGSWDPKDEWSRLGGRIYQTAVCTLSLEVYYRYRVEEDKK